MQKLVNLQDIVDDFKGILEISSGKEDILHHLDVMLMQDEDVETDVMQKLNEFTVSKDPENSEDLYALRIAYLEGSLMSLSECRTFGVLFDTVRTLCNLAEALEAFNKGKIDMSEHLLTEAESIVLEETVLNAMEFAKSKR